jgi:hypothetical protein
VQKHSAENVTPPEAQLSQTWLFQAGTHAGSDKHGCPKQGLMQALKQALKQGLKQALEHGFDHQRAVMQTWGDSVYSTSMTAKTAGSKDRYRCISRW